MNNQLKIAQTKLGKCIIIVGLTMTMIIGAGAEANTTEDGCSATAGYPCTHDLELEAYPLSRVPTTFKFQAKISQAKLPVGDVKFPQIIVLIKNGDKTECREEIPNIAVYDSVLNLEIGANIDCDLDEIIAKYDNLGIDVCIANDQNCLKRVKLGTVPYAVKSTYAFEAAKADKSNHAVECHYAHRVAADANLFDAKSIGTGFYNFHTPTDLDLLMGGLFEGQSVPDKYYRGGYIQWAPVTNDNANLHICRMHVDSVTDTPMTLDELFLHAKATHMTGVVTVWGDQKSGTTDFTVKGDSLIEENQRVMKNQNVDQQLAVGGHAVIGQGEQTIDYSANADGLDVFGPGVFHNSVFVDETLDVSGRTMLGNTLNVTGASTLNNTLDVVGATNLSNTLYVKKAATFGDTLTITGQTNANGGLEVQNGCTISGNAVFNNNVSINDGGLDVLLGQTHLAGGLTVDANTLINDNITIGTVATANDRNMNVHHDTTFFGGVHFEKAEVTGLKEGLVLGSDNIGAGTINSEKIENGTIASIDIADGTITAADLAPGTNTNAGTICSNNQVLTGGGTCRPYQTNTNAGTICRNNQVLIGGGTCMPYQTDTNTNAATICPDNKFLRGDGMCIANPIDENAHVSQALYADNNLTVAGTLNANDLIVVGKITDGSDWALTTDKDSQENLVIMEPEDKEKVWARFKDDDGLYLDGTPNLYVKGTATVGGNLTTKSLSVTDKISVENINFKTMTLGSWTHKSGTEIPNALFCFLNSVIQGQADHPSSCSIYQDKGVWKFVHNKLLNCGAICILK